MTDPRTVLFTPDHHCSLQALIILFRDQGRLSVYPCR